MLSAFLELLAGDGVTYRGVVGAVFSVLDGIVIVQLYETFKKEVPVPPTTGLQIPRAVSVVIVIVFAAGILLEISAVLR